MNDVVAGESRREAERRLTSAVRGDRAARRRREGRLRANCVEDDADVGYRIAKSVPHRRGDAMRAADAVGGRGWVQRDRRWRKLDSIRSYEPVLNISEINVYAN